MSDTEVSLTAYFHQQVGAGQEVERARFVSLLAHSPLGKRYPSERLFATFTDHFFALPAEGSPAPAAAPSRSASSKGSPSLIRGTSSPKTLLQRARGRSSPSPEKRDGRPLPPKPRYGLSHFLAAYRELPDFCAEVFGGVIIVGNGRSVLGGRAGPCVDQFATVIRFNDYQISGYEEDVGRKTDVWCVSDWTCAKLFGKYPERTLPTLIAIPYKFMGKP